MLGLHVIVHYINDNPLQLNTTTAAKTLLVLETDTKNNVVLFPLIHGENKHIFT